MEAGKVVPPSFQIEQLQPPPPPPAPLWKLMTVSSLAAGVMFGWALQFSLMTPYVQLLGFPHSLASFVWLGGPISGMVVPPVVGYYSDNFTSCFGRRRPFIVAGTAFVSVGVFLVSFAADIGVATGDPLGKSPKPRAIAVFVVGFWIFDVFNNMIQGPCRALLADISVGEDSNMRKANAMYAFFMAVGSVLGYAAGSYSNLHKMFPFTQTKACDIYCANLKSCFFLYLILLSTLTILSSTLIKETVLEKSKLKNSYTRKRFFLSEIFGAVKDLPRPMWILLLVMFLNMFAAVPFFLYDTDWMGREVYGGTVGEGNLYDRGVRAGALGLMIGSIVLGIVSLGVEGMSRGLGGVNKLWGGANFLLAVFLSLTIVITKLAESSKRYTTTSDGNVTALPPVPGIKAAALALFGVMGIPQAVIFSVPFALASIYSSKTGAGQGLTIGVLNIAICIPQLIYSLAGGPWDALFGGGNLPGFIVGAISAVASGIFALFLLPSPSSISPEIKSPKPATTTTFHSTNSDLL